MATGAWLRCRAWAVLLAGTSAALLCATAAAAVTIQVAGRVAHAGNQQLKDGARLSDAVLTAEVSPDAYVLGAAWLRPRLQVEQTRLKAGVLHELAVLAAKARLNGDPALTALSTRLKRQLQALPVTGRQTGVLLDPRPLEISPHNHLLADGDRLIYPPRPAHVRVVGAVEQDCVLPHMPMQAAPLYLHTCRLATGADPDWLYLIQPDGTVLRHGIAQWNRDPPQALAPGAVLYVPIHERALRTPEPGGLNDRLNRFPPGRETELRSDSLNEELARFLATQSWSVTAR